MINKFEDEYAFLSNFYPSPIHDYFYGIIYPTIEHAFQAQKTLDLQERRVIAAAPTPGKAKYLGRNVILRPNWNSIKEEVMYDYVFQKFYTHPELKEKLLATGDEYLEEGNWWGDTTWGVCNGIGQNKLGQILMRVRKELKE